MSGSDDRLREFLRSTDFMRLGQAVHMHNPQGAVMIINGMQRTLAGMGSDLFARELISLKQCIANNSIHDAEDILAAITAKRVSIQKSYGDV